MSAYPTIFQMIDVPPIAPAQAFCRHLRGCGGTHFIEAYEPDISGGFASRDVWFGISEGVGLLVMQWLQARGYEMVNQGRSLHA